METPDFIERDAAGIVSELVVDLEARTGKTLYPAQPERLMIDFMAYRESLLRAAVQDAASLNLVRFSRGEILDELATDRGMARLPAFAAGCLLTFRVPVALPTAIPIPVGTVVSTGDGAVSVATRSAATLTAGCLSVSVAASALEVGTTGNGYVAGQINQLVSILPGAPATLSVANADTSNGGADAETDERLRQRLLLAFDSYSVGGPVPAYRVLAMNQHPDVIDVGVVSHQPGEVTLYPLQSGGPAGPTVIDAVLTGVADEQVRVLCDTIRAAPPVTVGYAVRATLTLHPGDRADDILPKARAAVRARADQLASRLAGEIVPSQFNAVLQTLVHRVELSEPGYLACERWEWPSCTTIDLRIAEGT